MSQKRWTRLFRAEPAAEVEDELAFHLEQRVRDYMERGMDEASARAAAAARLGELGRVRAECEDLLVSERRAESRRVWLDDLRQDVRFGVRAAVRAPLFTVMAIVTLALGIGANAAVFGVVKSVLLDSLPYADPDRLVRVYAQFAASDLERSSVSPGAYRDVSERLRSFAAISGFNSSTFDVTYVDNAGPTVLTGAVVGGSFFPTLGVRPALGRLLLERDEGQATAVLSHAAWQQNFGADSSVLGRTLRLAGESIEVVGVLPADFVSPLGTADVWFGLSLAGVLADPQSSRDQHWMGVVGRVAPGVALEEAQRELDLLNASLAREHPRTDGGRTFRAVPLREAMVGDTRTPLLLLLAGAGLVLLVTCANLAGALLSRTISRRKEFAVRVALGAGRARLVRQLLTETVLLSGAGALAGLLLAAAGLGALQALAAQALPAHAELALDAGAVLITVVVALITGVSFGMAPALTLGRAAPQGTLREENRGTSESRRSRHLRGALVAAQIALSLSLLAGSGLLVRSLWAMMAQPPGFEPDGALAAGVQLPTSRYPSADVRARFFGDLEERVRALPGVTAVASTSQLPSPDMTRNSLVIEGVTLPGAGPTFIPYMAVSDDYFRTLQIDVQRGRAFGPQDDADAPPAIIISQAMAHRYWPGEDPVGKRLRISPHTAEQWGTIIGVVADMRSDPTLPEPEPLAYASNRQDFTRSGRTFVVRSQGDPSDLIRPLQLELAALDPELPLRDPTPLRVWLSDRLTMRRLPVLLITAFGSLALVLAAVGIYAMFASMAAAREAEFGVRMALGSTRRAIVTLVLRQGAAWMLVGLAGGALGIVLVAALLRSLLFDVAAFDPLAIGMAVLALVISAAAALIVPVRRAARVDPASVLR